MQHSRSSELWSSIVRRTNKEGSYQKKNTSYNYSANNFESYQSFASWCQTKEDYWNRDDNGRWWQLDKDLLIRGNKLYSPNTCIFVPQLVNVCYSNVKAGNCGFVGVRFDSKTQKYVSRCCTHNSKKRHIGYYASAYEAHKAWQLAKVYETEQLIKKNYSTDVNNLLLNIKERLLNDIFSGEATINV